MSMPNCYKIFDFWKDKRITEGGNIVDEPDSFKGRRVVDNEYIPSCWACGRPVRRKDLLSWEKYDLEIEEIWKDKKINSNLQRCHIVAKQFGGSDDPSNLFLMCEDCHAESPDTTNTAAFFRWVYRRKGETCWGLNWKKFISEMTSEIEARGYNLEEFAYEYLNLSSKERDCFSEKFGSKCGAHGATVADSTMAISAVDTIEEIVLAARDQELSCAV